MVAHMGIATPLVMARTMGTRMAQRTVLLVLQALATVSSTLV
jgi:hypothetical protein